MKKPVTVTITGAAGQIGYALAFRVASGQMLGPNQPVNLNLLEIPPAMGALNGVVMELYDCAFPTLNAIVATDDPMVAFKDCWNWPGNRLSVPAVLPPVWPWTKSWPRCCLSEPG